MSTPAGQYIQPTQQNVSTEQNGMAVAGFVLALIGLLLCWVPVINLFGDFLAVLGLVFGGVGMSRGRNGGKGLAIAAVAMALVALAVSIIGAVAFAAS
jgi:hypothetical protein